MICSLWMALPPIIGVDQEGGRVRRLMAEATPPERDGPRRDG